MADGFVAIGGASSFFIKSSKDTNPNRNVSWDFANRGTLSIGNACILWDHTMENEPEEVNNEQLKIDENTGDIIPDDYYKGIWNQGNILAGFCSFTNLRANNDGVVLVAARSVIRTPYNAGVIIGGNINDQLENFGRSYHTDFYNKYKEWHTHVAGPGVFIRGCLRVRDDNAVKGIKITPSLIQLSDNHSLATELKGNLKLTNDCNIWDGSGQQIVKNGELILSK